MPQHPTPLRTATASPHSSAATAPPLIRAHGLSKTYVTAAGDVPAVNGLDFTEQRDLFAGHVTAKRLADARAFLVARGTAVTVEQPTGGRPRSITFYAQEAQEAQKARGVSALSELLAREAEHRSATSPAARDGDEEVA